MPKQNETSGFSSFKELGDLKAELTQAEKQQAEKQKNQLRAAKQMIEQLKKTYPTVFNVENPLPLAVGIEKALRKLHPEWAVPGLRAALSIWTKRELYLAAVISGTSRFNLDGSAAGDLQESEKEYSKALLDKKSQPKKQPAAKSQG